MIEKPLELPPEPPVREIKIGDVQMAFYLFCTLLAVTFIAFLSELILKKKKK